MAVKLRRLKFDDADKIAEHLQDSNVKKFLSNSIPQVYSMSQAEKLVRRAGNRFPQYAAIEYEDNFAGVINLEQRKDVFCGNMEIGYWVAAPFQGRGIGKIAVRAMTRYAFSSDEIHRVYAHVFSENEPSIRVLIGCGYELQGLYPEALIKENKLYDCHVYACNRDKWQHWDSNTQEFRILYYNRTI